MHAESDLVTSEREEADLIVRLIEATHRVSDLVSAASFRFVFHALAEADHECVYSSFTNLEQLESFGPEGFFDMVSALPARIV